MKVPVFVQPVSDKPCLLGMNTLPQLGIQFLHENGISLLPDSDPPQNNDGSVAKGDRRVPDSPKNSIQDQKPPTTAVSRHSEETDVNNPPPKSSVHLIRSTYLPNGSTRVLEATLTSPFTEGSILLFEPDPNPKPEGLDMPKVLVKQQNDLLVMENHSALSSYLKAGQCVGTVTPIEDVSAHEVTTTEPDKSSGETEEACSLCSRPGVSDPSSTKAVTPVTSPDQRSRSV